MSGLSDIGSNIGSRIGSVTSALAKADAELKWEMAASAADVAGMIDPTPVSDLVGAGLSLRKGDFLGAGMSVASMLPYVGDALAKPVKAVRAAKTIVAIEKKIASLTKQLNELRALEKQAVAAEKAAKEAKAASKALPTAAPKPKAKQAAEQQQAAAKAGKDKDCESCAAAGKADVKMPRYTLKSCFSGKKLPAAKAKEFAAQLKRQEEALNKLTVKQFEEARAFFRQKGRKGTGAAQKKARADYQALLIDDLSIALRKADKTLTRAQIKEQAEAAAKATMKTLAALHEPDMIAGGADSVKSMGDKSVNSSIGSQWKNRVKELDATAAKIPEAERGKMKMNVKLTLCK